MLLLSLLKASLVLALAQLIVVTIRPLSAAAKHLILTAGLASFLMIPLLAFIGPPLPVTVEMLPRRAAWSASAADRTAPKSDRVVATPPARAFRSDEIPVLVWLLGTAAVVAHLLRSARRVRSIVAGASVPSARLHALLEETRRRLAIDASVRLLRSDRIYVPMVWGVRSGTLLLPEVAEEWTEEHLRATFIHELGHLQRLDYVSLALMNLVTALLWFHPQVWLARRRALTEGERACDDLVLGAGERASAYASHLLHVAGMTPRHESLAALLAMSRPSQLEGRMVSILSTSTNRQAIGGKQFMISLASFIALVVPFSWMQMAALPAVATTKAVAVRPVTVVVAAAPAAAVEPAFVSDPLIATEAAKQAREAEPATVTIASEPATVAEEAEVVSAVPEVEAVQSVAAEEVPVIEPVPATPFVMQVLSRADIGSRPFQVIEKVEGRTCTLKLMRATNSADASGNPAQALAMKRLLQNAEEKGANAVTDLKCAREIRIGLSCPTAVVCEAEAIQLD